MSTLYFSGYVNGGTLQSANYIGAFMATNSVANIYAVFGTGAVGSGFLEIYKGTVPTFPAFTDASSRSSDLLIRFSLTGGQTGNKVGNETRCLMGRQLVDTAATATGEATWFLARRSNTTSLTTSGGIIGSVGITGSGADLEVPNTAIVVGQNYQSAGFTLAWSLGHTV